MDNEEEVTSEEYQIELMEKHHKEMINAIRSIKFPESKDNSDIVNKLNSLCDILCKKLDNLPQPKVTVEKTEVNQSEVIGILKNLVMEIKSLNKEEKKEDNREEKKRFSFDIVRDNFGNIQSVIAKQQ